MIALLTGSFPVEPGPAPSGLHLQSPSWPRAALSRGSLNQLPLWVVGREKGLPITAFAFYSDYKKGTNRSVLSFLGREELYRQWKPNESVILLSAQESSPRAPASVSQSPLQHPAPRPTQGEPRWTSPSLRAWGCSVSPQTCCNVAWGEGWWSWILGVPWV